MYKAMTTRTPEPEPELQRAYDAWTEQSPHTGLPEYAFAAGFRAAQALAIAQVTSCAQDLQEVLHSSAGSETGNIRPKTKVGAIQRVLSVLTGERQSFFGQLKEK